MRPARPVLVALWLLLAACGSPARPAGDDFGPEQARALIPEASGINGAGARVIAELGAGVTWRDIEAGGSTPLTAVLLTLGPLPYGDPERGEACAAHFRCPLLGAATTPKDLIEGLDGVSEIRKDDRGIFSAESTTRSASFLEAKALREVTCRREGDRAHGTVSFSRTAKRPSGDETGILYEGNVEWSASKGASGWAIDEFRLPGCEIRIRLVSGEWKAEDTAHSGGPYAPQPDEVREVPASVLPRTATSEPAPTSVANTWIATLRTDGRMRLEGPVGSLVRADGMSLTGHVGSLEQFRSAVRFAARDGASHGFDGDSENDLVLRVHPETPWSVVDMALLVCDAERLLRVHFAVRGETGDDVRVIPCFLPKDVEIPDPNDLSVPDLLRVLVTVLPDARSVESAVALAGFRRRIGDTGAKHAAVMVRAGVAAGNVIRVLDDLRKAGATSFEFPFVLGAGRPKSPSDLTGPPEEFVRAHSVKERGFSLRINWETIVGREEPAPKPR